MNKMMIFDPAMCCSTGVCGPSVNPELLRVATVLNTLKNKGILVERYNLTGNPQIFIDNKIVNEILMNRGVESLPIVIVNGKVMKLGGYPTNKEFCKWLDISEKYLKGNSMKKDNKCNCKGGCC
ncbi:arsenite efflux transporter metallochaperone ArsD [Clostridium botulinum]|uniref:Arsenite efflux transporter metallochaperone ArsD n=1 Tax=Clostridium botulinum TaxID=1491 RepID=A0A6B4JIW2_CLOBO|nr:arsenite efflux transporter metallochaperone ArsD [Clostridium botulinum]EES48774.1 arsenical resistance operon trans-acting repressor ArsD [Clostridium botulinum E1 str. 'BoNT E Beluga']MBY6760641.1 arsenite efflux transporter metallochaperone ArsD [Clostridium botulinum]MBY6919548.1 arsenite efflux transporter metallochaperone ArsD [Clostridium botulinum]MCR1130427.1 arsenite efflux transporter metallochaperone ArsD [Clostridium botulinum]NFH70667.1 arsenite efflux transporter metallochap